MSIGQKNNLPSKRHMGVLLPPLAAAQTDEAPKPPLPSHPPPIHHSTLHQPEYYGTAEIAQKKKKVPLRARLGLAIDQLPSPAQKLRAIPGHLVGSLRWSEWYQRSTVIAGATYATSTKYRRCHIPNRLLLIVDCCRDEAVCARLLF